MMGKTYTPRKTGRISLDMGMPVEREDFFVGADAPILEADFSDIEARVLSQETPELYEADPACNHNIIDAAGGGIKCTKCKGWFCY